MWWWSCICTRMVPATLLLCKKTSCHSLLKAPSWFQIEYVSFVRKTALDFLGGHLKDNIVHRILKSSSQNLMHLKSKSSKSVIRQLDKSHLICQIEFRSLGESGNQLENFCMYSRIVPLGLTRPKWIKQLCLPSKSDLPTLIFPIITHSGTRSVMPCNTEWTDTDMSLKICAFCL